MNGNQQRKALSYSIIFLANEIEALEESVEVVEDPLTKPLLKKRLKELKSDYDMFVEISEEFI